MGGGIGSDSPERPALWRKLFRKMFPPFNKQDPSVQPPPCDRADGKIDKLRFQLSDLFFRPNWHEDFRIFVKGAVTAVWPIRDAFTVKTACNTLSCAILGVTRS